MPKRYNLGWETRDRSYRGFWRSAARDHIDNHTADNNSCRKRTQGKDNYKIQVFHKPFSEDTSLLIKFLKNPHEEIIEDKLSCRGPSV